MRTASWACLGACLAGCGNPTTHWRLGALATALQTHAACNPLHAPCTLQGWICQSVIVFGFPYTPDYIWDIPVVTVILTLLPWSPLAKACGARGGGMKKRQGRRVCSAATSHRAAICCKKG